MTIFLTIQIAFNVIIVTTGWLLYRRLQRAYDRAEQRRESVVQQSMSDRLEAWEKELQEMRETFSGQLTTLKKICDKAADTLNRAEFKSVALFPSEEEQEIKKIFRSQTEKIPTVKDVESTKERLKGEIGVDLRTVLKDQLS